MEEYPGIIKTNVTRNKYEGKKDVAAKSWFSQKRREVRFLPFWDLSE